MASLVTFSQAQSKLPLPATEKWPEGVWDHTPFAHGSMSLVLFTPQGHDYQTPHSQDELYIVHRGSGKLVTPGQTLDFSEGDVLFVPAGEEHRFEEFTDGLTLWAVFWGPQGGEQG